MACIRIRIAIRFLVLLFVAGLGLQSAYSQQYDPSFDRPQQISDNPNADFAPRIATSGDHVYVVWTNEEPAVLFRKSADRSEEHTSELQSRLHLVCSLLLEKKQTSSQPRAAPHTPN